ncbi:MAG: hypothetical protein KGJ07_00530 [Patescibacteria group bacterium]|nr:hypothetical protein [Patescibacteria group bacterium]
MKTSYRTRQQILIEVLQYIRENPKTNASKMTVNLKISFGTLWDKLGILIESEWIKQINTDIKGYRLDGTPKRSLIKEVFIITDKGNQILKEIKKETQLMGVAMRY